MPQRKRYAKTEIILKKMTEKKFETQKSLAAAAGLDDDTMTSILSGDHSGSTATYKKLAIQLGVEDWRDLVNEQVTMREVATEKKDTNDHQIKQHSVTPSLVTEAMECVVELCLDEDWNVESVDAYLGVLGDLCRAAIDKNISWLDVMKLVSPANAPSADRLLSTVNAGTLGWLQIIYSEVPRTTRPRLIPIDVGGKPWRGSGAAFLAAGIDYVDRMVTRLVPSEYDIPKDEAAVIAKTYQQWEDEHHFASLVAIAIPRNRGSSVGVLNMNFEHPFPFDKSDTLPPDQLRRISETLAPNLRVLAHVLEKTIDE